MLDDVFGPLPDVEREHAAQAGQRRREPTNRRLRRLGLPWADRFSQPPRLGPHGRRELPEQPRAEQRLKTASVEQAHVAAVRGNLEATIVEALVTDAVEPGAELREAFAYVEDPAPSRTQRRGPGRAARGRRSDPLRASIALRLLEQAEKPRRGGRPRDAEAVADGADLAAPPPEWSSPTWSCPRAPPSTAPAVPRGLRRTPKNGGQLVLTDRAVELVDDLGVGARGRADGEPDRRRPRRLRRPRSATTRSRRGWSASPARPTTRSCSATRSAAARPTTA